MENIERFFKLMYKDEICIVFDSSYKVLDFNENVKLPYGMRNDPNLLKIWLEKRFNIGTRPNYDKLLQEYGLVPSSSTLMKCIKTHATSFRDCYWVKESGDTTTWEQVSPYLAYYNEMLDILLGDEAILPPIPSPSCAEFTYRGKTAKGYHRNLRTGELSVIKIPSNNRLLFRELISSKLGKYFDLDGLEYKLSSREFTTGEVKKCLLVDSTSTEGEGFITLQEYLANKDLDYNSASPLDIYNKIPEQYQKEYILARVILYLLCSEQAVEDRFSFRVINDTQEICGYFGVFGNAQCLGYDGNNITSEHLYALEELLQVISEDLNRLLTDKLECLDSVFDEELNNLANELIEDEEYEMIKDLLMNGAESVLNILRNLNSSTVGKIETLDNSRVIIYDTEPKNRYDRDGFLKLSEDSNYNSN